MILTATAWAATAAILITYALTSVCPGKQAVARFHLANALGFLPLALLNLKAHTYPALTVNLGFGIPAVYAVSGELRDRWAARGGLWR